MKIISQREILFIFFTYPNFFEKFHEKIGYLLKERNLQILSAEVYLICREAYQFGHQKHSIGTTPILGMTTAVDIEAPFLDL